MRKMEAILLGKTVATGALTVGQAGLLVAYVALLIEHHASDVIHEPLMHTVVQLGCSTLPHMHDLAGSTASLLASKTVALRTLAVDFALQNRTTEAVAVLAGMVPQTVSWELWAVKFLFKK